MQDPGHLDDRVVRTRSLDGEAETLVERDRCIDVIDELADPAHVTDHRCLLRRAGTVPQRTVNFPTAGCRESETLSTK